MNIRNFPQLNFPAAIIIICIICAACMLSAMAQSAADFGKEVSLQHADAFERPGGCSRINNMVYNEETLKELLAFKQCAEVVKAAQIDLKKQTLIGYHVGGDCMMRLENHLYRDDAKKLYTFVIKNIDGGCRAGGWKYGLYKIDKIPTDYEVKFVEYFVDKYNSGRIREADDSGVVWGADGLRNVDKSPAAAPVPINIGGHAIPTRLELPADPVPLETRETDLKGCIQLFIRKEITVTTNEEFLKAVRDDASRGRCLKEDNEKLDFTKNSLIGINLDTGYCRYPAGLQYQAFRDDTKKQVVLKISYIDPKGSVCRARSSYDLWVQIPKIPDRYEVKFEEKAVGF